MERNDEIERLALALADAAHEIDIWCVIRGDHENYCRRCQARGPAGRPLDHAKHCTVSQARHATAKETDLG